MTRRQPKVRPKKKDKDSILKTIAPSLVAAIVAGGISVFTIGRQTSQQIENQRQLQERQFEADTQKRVQERREKLLEEKRKFHSEIAHLLSEFGFLRSKLTDEYLRTLLVDTYSSGQPPPAMLEAVSDRDETVLKLKDCYYSVRSKMSSAAVIFGDAYDNAAIEMINELAIKLNPDYSGMIARCAKLKKDGASPSQAGDALRKEFGERPNGATQGETQFEQKRKKLEQQMLNEVIQDFTVANEDADQFIQRMKRSGSLAN